jgi:KipI family sensor histidine kinase inhibitor
VTRALAAGDEAVLLDLAADDQVATEPDATDGGAAARLAAAVRALGLPGVTDVIPGARTVLVTTEPGSWPPGELGARLAAVPVPPVTAGADGPLVEFPVCYDGPDLADVAALTGLPVREVVARHQAVEYRVGWMGFAPGFGYLTGLDPALSQVPRLDSPRVAVPAGSVAIAGGLAAVYPASSPGGWRLLGRTEARPWDPRRDPPALLAPGTRVRFLAVDELPGPAAAGPVTAGPVTAGADSAGPAIERPQLGRSVEVLQPGPLTTIQDLGRSSAGHLGVPPSGAADRGSLRRANALAGNEAGAAALEVTLGRLALRFHSTATMAVAGAPVPLTVTSAAGTTREPLVGTAVTVQPGDVVRLGSPRAGLRSYLAVDGGFDVPPMLGSRSADLLSGLGPPPLRAGLMLPLGSPRPSTARPAAAGPGPSGREPRPAGDPVELAVVAGPRDDWFDAAALATLTSAEYQVTTASNRTGLRLAGPPLRRANVAELPSEGMVTGALEVAHDGQPILLLTDHPATGGYPVIAVVRTPDIDLAAQLRPGQRVRFRTGR